MQESICPICPSAQVQKVSKYDCIRREISKKCTLAHVNLAEIGSVRSLEAVEAVLGVKTYLPFKSGGNR